MFPLKKWFPQPQGWGIPEEADEAEEETEVAKRTSFPKARGPDMCQGYTPPTINAKRWEENSSFSP